MNRSQWTLFAVGVAMVVILYFIFDIRPPEAEQQDQQRSLQSVQTSAEVLIREKLPKLPEETNAEIHALNAQLANAGSTQDSIQLLKQLSGAWYSAGEKAVAGHYAEIIAEILNTAEAWSITGTTFASGLNEESLPKKELAFISQHSRQAFENAISLEPANVDHRVNLAVTFVQQPPESEPMKGIQMLLRLSEKHPDNPAVLFQLGRFGMQTGQYEKASNRLEKVVELEPNRREAYCLLSTAYRELGQLDKALEAEKKCKKLN